MNTNYKKYLFYIFLFGIAFGFIEATVVIYLRHIYYPEGFSFPIKIISDRIIFIEYLRELATLLLIFSASYVAGRTKMERFAYFMYIFGIWDIFYYVFLKIFLNWPSSILEYDLLFLIPVAWVGPVLAPVIISVLLITAGIIIIYFENNGYKIYQSKLLWTLEISGGFIVFVSFILSAGDVINKVYPTHFYWWLFFLGVLIAVLAFIYSVFKTIKKS